MATPRFSVLICTIGSEYLGQIISTFLESTQPVEIVLVFDDPAIKPEQFLDHDVLGDVRVRVFINDRNIGLTRSLNIGAHQAQGDIIVRIDDDDLPDPTRLDELAAYYDSNPDTDIVFSYARGVDEQTGKSWIIDGPHDHASIVHKLEQRNFIVHSSLSFKKDSVAAIGYYSEAFRFAQDYELYLRAVRRGLRFGCIPKVLVTRQYLSTSITVSKRKRQILHSMAARLLHCAQADKGAFHFWPTIVQYLILLATPNWARRLRRSLGRGK